MAASKFIFIAFAFMVLAASSVPAEAAGWVFDNCLRPCTKTYHSGQCNVDCIEAGFESGDCYEKRQGAGEFVCCCPHSA